MFVVVLSTMSSSVRLFLQSWTRLSSFPSSSSNEGNNWVTISSSVNILAHWIAITAKYLRYGSPGRAAVISNESSVQAVGILLPTDNSSSYQGSVEADRLPSNLHHSYNLRSSSPRWPVCCETESTRHFYFRFPRVLQSRGVPEKRPPTPQSVRTVCSFSSTSTKKRKNISLLCFVKQGHKRSRR